MWRTPLLLIVISIAGLVFGYLFWRRGFEHLDVLGIALRFRSTSRVRRVMASRTWSAKWGVEAPISWRTSSTVT